MKAKKPNQPAADPPAPRQKGDAVLAKKLRDLRLARGWTQYDMAHQIGRHQSRIAKWETCQGVPEPRDMVAFANAFGVPIAYLCDHEMKDPRDADPDRLNDDEKLLIGVIRKIGPEKAMDRLTSPPQEKPRESTEARPTVPTPKRLTGWRRRRRRPNS